MERLTLALQRAEQALSSLQSVMQIRNPSEIERDAAMQRFKFTFEAMWKAARHYLREIEGIDVGSPKGVIRACREGTLFNEEETEHALEMADDRNLTSHTYDRALAAEIFERLSGHTTLMSTWLERMRQKT